MPTISALTPLRFFRRRICVEVNGQPWKVLEKSTVSALGLEVGGSLDEDFAWAEAFPYEQEAARERALYLLGLRARTAKELEFDLRRRDFDGDVIESTLEMLYRVDLIDDEALARRQAEMAEGKLSKRALEQNLRKRGVSSDIIRDTVIDFDDEAELAAARREVEKRLRSNTQPSREQQASIIQALARKGFSYEIARSALAASLDEVADWDVE